MAIPIVAVMGLCTQSVSAYTRAVLRGRAAGTACAVWEEVSVGGDSEPERQAASYGAFATRRPRGEQRSSLVRPNGGQEDRPSDTPMMGCGRTLR
jgi:hypothetical protein